MKSIYRDKGFHIHHYSKPLSCPLRKTKPIGALTMCLDVCKVAKECIAMTREDRANGITEFKTSSVVKPNGKTIKCPIGECFKIIARPHTSLISAKGMFKMHVKHKHFDHLDYFDLLWSEMIE